MLTYDDYLYTTEKEVAKAIYNLLKSDNFRTCDYCIFSIIGYRAKPHTCRACLTFMGLPRIIEDSIICPCDQLGPEAEERAWNLLEQKGYVKGGEWVE